MRPTYPDHTEAQRGDQSLEDQIHSVESETLTAAQPHSEENHRAKSWRAIPYRVVLLSFVFLAALAWTRRDFNGREIPDWKPVLVLADTARERGDLYYAKSLYLQVGRLAAWRDDWAGLLAAACGIKKTGQGKRSLFSNEYASSSRYGCSRDKAKSIRDGRGRQSIFSIEGGQSRLHGPVAHPNELG